METLTNIQELKTGDLIGCRTPFKLDEPMSWLSTAIRGIAGIKDNHLAIVVKNWDLVMINEAVGRGLISTPAEFRFEKGREYDVLRPSAAFLTEKEFATRANELLGHTGYDYRGLLRDQLLLQVFHKWYGKNGDAAKERMYCYEYAAYMYQERYKEWWAINPKVMLNDEYFIHYKLKVV